MPDVLQLRLVFWPEPTPAGCFMATTASRDEGEASGDEGAGCREGAGVLAAGEREKRGDFDPCGRKEKEQI